MTNVDEMEPHDDVEEEPAGPRPSKAPATAPKTLPATSPYKAEAAKVTPAVRPNPRPRPPSPTTTSTLDDRHRLAAAGPTPPAFPPPPPVVAPAEAKAPAPASAPVATRCPYIGGSSGSSAPTSQSTCHLWSHQCATSSSDSGEPVG